MPSLQLVRLDSDWIHPTCRCNVALPLRRFSRKKQKHNFKKHGKYCMVCFITGRKALRASENHFLVHFPPILVPSTHMKMILQALAYLFYKATRFLTGVRHLVTHLLCGLKPTTPIKNNRYELHDKHSSINSSCLTTQSNTAHYLR